MDHPPSEKLRYTHHYTLSAYGWMLSDQARLEAFCKALEMTVSERDVVLDIGAGTGFFSCFAAKLGARQVHAIEFNPLVKLADETAKENGLTNLTTHNEYSYEVELQERATVLVHDMKAQLPFTPGTRATLLDAMERLLSSEATLIPRAEKVYAALVTDPEFVGQADSPWVEGIKGLTFDCFRPYCAQHRLYEKSTEASRGQAFELWTIDYRKLHELPSKIHLRFTVPEKEIRHGLVLWFESELCDGVSLSTDPWENARATVYGNRFVRFKHPVCFEPDTDYLLDVAFGTNDDIELTLERDLGWTLETICQLRNLSPSDEGLSVTARVDSEKAQRSQFFCQKFADGEDLSQVFESSLERFPTEKRTELARSLYAQALFLQVESPQALRCVLEFQSWAMCILSDSEELLNAARDSLAPSWTLSERETEVELSLCRVLSSDGALTYELKTGTFSRHFQDQAGLLEALTDAAFEALRLSLSSSHLFLEGSLVVERGITAVLLGSDRETRLKTLSVNPQLQVLCEDAVIIDSNGHPLAYRVGGKAVVTSVGPVEEIRFFQEKPPSLGASLLLLSTLCSRPDGSPPLARLKSLMSGCELGVWQPAQGK